MATIFQVNDHTYSDDEILAELLAQDEAALAGQINAAEFIEFAESAAGRVYGALSLADDTLGAWVYPDGSIDVAEKPQRLFVTFAAAAEYPSRESLAAQFIFNARRCVRCDGRAVKHNGLGGTCDEFQSGIVTARRVA